MTDLDKAVKNKFQKLSGANSSEAKALVKEAGQLIKKAENAKSQESRQLIAQAVDLYSRAIDLCPGKPEPYLALAYISWSFGKTEDAVRIIKTVQEIDPHNFRAREMLDEIKKESIKKEISGKVSQASQKSLSQAIKSKPKSDFSLFSKIQSIFSFKPAPGKKSAKNDFKEIPAIAQAKSAPVTVRNANGDFLSLVRDVRKQSGK